MLALFLAAAAVTAAPPCDARHLSVAVDGRDGDFNGMSHGGAMLILRNMGRRSCSLPGLPLVTFHDEHGRRLGIARKVPSGMHPGLVILPVSVAPAQAVSTPLRWVTGEVYEHSTCLTPRTIEVAVDDRVVKAPFAGRLCGPAGGSVAFDQPPLRPGTSM